MTQLSLSMPVEWWEPAWGTFMAIGLLCLVALIVDLARNAFGDDHTKPRWWSDR